MILTEKTQKILSLPEPLTKEIKSFVLSCFRTTLISFKTEPQKQYTQEELILILNFFVKEIICQHSKLTLEKVSKKLEGKNSFSNLSNEMLNQYYSFLIANDGKKHAINATLAFNLLAKNTAINSYFDIKVSFNANNLPGYQLATVFLFKQQDSYLKYGISLDETKISFNLLKKELFNNYLIKSECYINYFMYFIFKKFNVKENNQQFLLSIKKELIEETSFQYWHYSISQKDKIDKKNHLSHIKTILLKTYSAKLNKYLISGKKNTLLINRILFLFVLKKQLLKLDSHLPYKYRTDLLFFINNNIFLLKKIKLPFKTFDQLFSVHTLFFLNLINIQELLEEFSQKYFCVGYVQVMNGIFLEDVDKTGIDGNSNTYEGNGKEGSLIEGKEDIQPHPAEASGFHCKWDKNTLLTKIQNGGNIKQLYALKETKDYFDNTYQLYSI